jgi:hypothetical protein
MVTHAHHATGVDRLLQRWLSIVARTRPTGAPAAALPALAPGEQVLCVEADGRGPVAATDRAIYHDEGAGWRRLGWEQVRRVDWDNRRSALLLWGLTPTVPRQTEVLLRRGSRLVALARERVAWCTVPVPRSRLDGVGTLLAVRRQPGSGELVWLVAFDAGVDAADRVRLDAALHRLRVEAGL